MLPQDVVRICFKSITVFKSNTWHSCVVLVAFALAATTGCRSPFGPKSNAEPSFDRLLELENSTTLLNSPVQPPNSYAQQQIAQRRPGGNTAASRYAEVDVQDGTGNSGESLAAKRRISDLDDSTESVDIEAKLLRQTQLALRNSTERAPDPHDEYADDHSEAPVAPRKKSAKRNSDDELVMRMTDKSTADLSDADESEDIPERPAKVDKLAGTRKPRPTANESIADEPIAKESASRKFRDDAVQPASQSSSKPDRAVQPAFQSFDESEEADEKISWEKHLRLAVEQLEDSSDQQLVSPQERVRQAMIARLLALSLNDREAMLNPIEGLQAHEQDYMNHQLSAIFDAIDPEANPVSSRKWSLVMLNQRKANTHLASLSNLEVNNLAFCTEVIDFGVTSPFPANKFSPDQEVLLYLELDNFVSERSKDGKGYETQLQGSYEIVDSSGRRVADHTLPADSHICKNVRRDYFIAYRVYMPPKISAGNYTLKLTVEDLKGRKFGQADIQFQIQQ